MHKLSGYFTMHFVQMHTKVTQMHALSG